MSLPRMFAPGATYMVTRNCFQKHFYLRPSKKMNQILKFCLAAAAKRTGVLLHNYTFLSSHYHATVTDVYGNLPDFMHWANAYIAKAVNAELGREQTFWKPGSYSRVDLTARADCIGKMIYVFNNPVSSGLVPTMKQWPGAYSTPADTERPAEIIERPKVFFREDGVVPSSVELQLSMPAHLDMSVAEMQRRVAEDEQKLRDEARAQGKGFLGRRQVLKQSPFGRARSREKRGGINPQVAAADKWRRIEALQRLKSFLSAYREAWLSFAAGDRDVVFPYGTYGMRVRFGVMCNGP